MATFNPPTASAPLTVEGGPDNAFMKYVKDGSFLRGINVFIDINNVVTTTQPKWENIKYCYYGGHATVLTVDAIPLLIAAGYSANITYP